MRVAALYDIHGNLPALEAVAHEVYLAGVDRVVVGGDVVPGPMPGECLALLRELDVPVLPIRGNGESALLAEWAGSDGGVRLVNAGSVGMPFGRAGADWLLLGPGVHPRHTDYDLAAAAGRLAATAYPDAAAFAERHVLHPPSEEEMLRAFDSPPR